MVWLPAEALKRGQSYGYHSRRVSSTYARRLLQLMPMHVLLIPSWYPASVDDVGGSFFREQAIALARYGYEVGVIHPQMASLRRPGTWATKLKAERKVVDAGVRTYRSPGINWFPKLPRASTAVWLHKGMRLFQHYVRENGMPDVLHAHSMFHGGLLAERISRRYQVPFVITEHSSVFARGLVHKWQIRSGARVVKQASETLAVSEALARLLGECYGSPTSHWKYLPNIVAEQFASAPLDVIKPTSDGKFTFCSIAYLSRQKGIDLLLRAFAKAFKSDTQMRLVIGGDGDERASLEQQARELGIASHVDFLGHLGREQVLNVMSGSDAIVLSSHYETFGVILIEALALGKPVLATRCGGPESIVQPDDGLLVETGNVGALAGGMLELRRNASTFNAHLIRQSCLERFSEAAIVERLSGIYEDAVGDASNRDG